jgi:hypothetical protein
MAQVPVVDRKDLVGATSQAAKRRTRPLTASQERLFFGVTFAMALLIQMAVSWMPMLAAHRPTYGPGTVRLDAASRRRHIAIRLYRWSGRAGPARSVV